VVDDYMKKVITSHPDKNWVLIGNSQPDFIPDDAVCVLKKRGKRYWTEFVSETINKEDDIRQANGHWYGEFYLPSSTIVVLGENVTSQDILRNQNMELKDGYIVVVFKTIKTKTSDTIDYLSYAKPDEKTRFEKEGATYTPYKIILPNGVEAEIPLNEEGIAMAIYEAGIRANDDYETEGTH
jgi:hypothetical protein